MTLDPAIVEALRRVVREEIERARLLAEPKERLVPVVEAARRIGGMDPSNFTTRYVPRWEALRDGARVVRLDPAGDGRMRILESALLEHMRVELLRGRSA